MKKTIMGCCAVAAALAVAIGLGSVEKRDAGLQAYERGDYAEAARMWEQTAERGGAEGHYGLGLLFLEGLGVPPDPARAYAHFRKAAELDHSDAQYVMGSLQMRGVSANYRKALSYFERSAEQENPKAQLRLAQLYHDGLIVAKNYEKAQALYLQAAAHGYVPAQIIVGTQYFSGFDGELFHGRGHEQDGLDWLQKAHAQVVQAGERDNLRIAKGEDVSEAQALLKAMAEQGEAEAQYRYGTYSGLHFVIADRQRWVEEAAAQGHAKAQYSLGASYLPRGGSLGDSTKAAAWIRQAAEQGYAPALSSYSMYVGDAAEAARWQAKAAEQGDASAQHLLGLRYLKGNGVSKSPNLALTWLARAAQKSKRARRDYEGLKRQLSGRATYSVADHRALVEAALAPITRFSKNAKTAAGACLGMLDEIGRAGDQATVGQWAWAATLCSNDAKPICAAASSMRSEQCRRYLQAEIHYSGLAGPR